MGRPSVLLISTDQQRWDCLPSAGNRQVVAPTLARLASESADFQRWFIQNPLCMPSRVSMLTGRYPSSLGITHMGVPVPEDLQTLPAIFERAGYETANLGKLHFLPHANRDHRRLHPSYGFDQVEISDEPGVYEDAYRAWVRRRDPSQLDRLSVGLPPAAHTWYRTLGLPDMVPHPAGEEPREDFDGPTPFPGDDGFTHTAYVADRTIEYLHSRRGREPFFCIAGFYSPHAPWVVPQRYLDLYDREALSGDPVQARARHGYLAMISEVDRHLAGILEALQETGLAESTLVVFTSDHGEWLGDGGRWGKGHPADDAVSRVPFLVCGPDVRPQRVEEMGEAVDLAPTLLELAGLPVPPELQGRSWAPRLLGRASGGVRDSALTEFRGWKTLRTDRFRYVVHQDGREYLWPAESSCLPSEDLSGQEPGALAEMRRLLLLRMIENEQPLERTWPY
ncbi:MAG: sulfatase-like hydrolase/transferase [Fimbriimonadaceae bacterium]|nr:sulfatase-like hydrolase/transferase [Fimbriimonadaceae bacterium]